MEELKILIKVVSDQAKKSMADVQKELDKIKDKGGQTGKSVDDAMKAIGKGVAVAVGAVGALTTALANLGKSAQEVQKGFDRLNTTFQNAGLTGKQASKTYEELFSYLGDHDKAVETAQTLALITNEEQGLSEWTQILKGAFAEMGEKLPTEALAEAANETIKVGQLTGAMADALTWVGVSEDAFNAQLAQTTSLSEREALVRNTLNGIYGNSASLYDANNKSTIEYNKSQAQLNMTLASLSAHLTPLLTSLNTLGSTLLTALGPAIQTVSLYLTAFIQMIAEAIQWVGSFFGLFGGEAAQSTASLNGYQSAMQNYMSSLQNYFGGTSEGIDENNKQIEKLKKATMGFDELNVVSNPATSASGASGGPSAGASLGAMPAAPNPSDFGLGGSGLGLDLDLSKAKEEIEGLLVLVGLVGAGLLTWKIADFIKQLKTSKDYVDKVKKSVKNVAGSIMTAAGAALLVSGYMKSWGDGVDWGNLATTLAGIGLIVGGLALQFGSLAASIALAVGGVAMLVLGVKDFIANGPTAQNTILIIGGAIATAVALATMGVGPLVAAIVGLTAAVAAFTIGILLEEPAIMSVKDAQDALTEAKNRAAEAENSYINAVDAAEASMKRLEEAEKNANMTGAELYAQVQSGILDYKDMTAEQKELYKAYVDNEQKQKDLTETTKAFEEAKKAETLASYEHQLALAKESGDYQSFKKSVVDAFKAGEISAQEAQDLISKSMSEMSDDSQKTFMEDLPSDLKNGLDPHKYESTGTKIKKWFSNLWKDIKGVFKDVKTWFKDIGEKIGEAVSGAVSNAINWILEKAIGIINGFIDSINWCIDILNAIPAVSISKITRLEVPKLATGGIVDGATVAMIGERGKEAVLPLENNTEWMDKLADRIASRNGAPSKIVLMVGERELGYATINSINNITKQTGNLQLVMV